MKKIISLSIFLFVSISINAQTPDPTLPELAWLTGYWTSSNEGNSVEEL